MCFFYPAHVCVSYVIGAGVHICNDPPISLNGTLAVNLPFQTLTVELLLNL